MTTPVNPAIFKLARLLGALLIAVATLGCIWDRDTLDDELRGSPDDFTLIVGRWHRHGDFYYERRIAEVLARLPNEPANFSLYDDLAVAYERLERRADAIATMERKAEAMGSAGSVDDEYRTLANLGTFFAHAGDYEAAIEQLEVAVALNPNAHFGRERLQIDLIRYVTAARLDPGVWERSSFLVWAGYSVAPPQAIRIRPHEDYQPALGREGRDLTPRELHEGVAGMLRFGGVEGPELYRALGDIHLAENDLNLAWWAFSVAVERGHPAHATLAQTIGAIEEHWSEAGALAVPTQADFVEVRAHAAFWLAHFHDAERAALAEGLDPGSTAVLDELIRETNKAAGRQPRVGPSRFLLVLYGVETRVALALLTAVLLPVVVVAGYRGLVRAVRRRLGVESG